MTKIAFIGAGNMNGAIISGLVKHGYCTDNIIVSNPSAPKRLALKEKLGILHTSNNLEAVKFADYIVLGVKPHLPNRYVKKLLERLMYQLNVLFQLLQAAQYRKYKVF